MSGARTVTGRQLYALLPEVYRTRDSGDLAAYLDACGELLDLVRGTLDQRLADCFPDREGVGRAAQDWLLPYFAQLLDVRLVSPHTEGRRLEIANAIGWRQRKGTLASLESIAEAVGQLEVEVDEGWRRVAVTPRVGVPLMPAGPLVPDPAVDSSHPIEAARRPGLPVVTPDVRHAARAVRSEADDPLAKASRFGGETHYWRPGHLQGVPCFPGSFDDPSRRLVDLRSPSWRAGHYHPRRLLLYVPPPTGLFPPDRVVLAWGSRADRPDLFAERSEDAVVHLFNPSFTAGTGTALALTGAVAAPADVDLRIDDLGFLGAVTVSGGRVTLRGVAARSLVVDTADEAAPVIDARSCLFESVSAPNGLVRMEYCTVRGPLACRRLQASDSLFTGEVSIAAAGSGEEPAGCIRYSRIPPELEEELGKLEEGRVPRAATTTAEPAFFDFPLCNGAGRRSSEFGQPGYAVLHPATPAAVCFGAEDGGEMGAYHEQRYCLQGAAVLDKLEDFLPVGIEAVLVPDPRLLEPPPGVAAAS